MDRVFFEMDPGEGTLEDLFGVCTMYGSLVHESTKLGG